MAASTDQELARLVVRLLGDSSEYVKMLQDAVAQTNKAGQSLQQSGQRVSDQTSKMFQRGAEIAQSVMKPAEVLKSRLLELNNLLKKGAIDQETFNRAVAKTKDELNGKNDLIGLLQGSLTSYALRMVGLGAALRQVSRIGKQVIQDLVGTDKAIHALEVSLSLASQATGRFTSAQDELFGKNASWATRIGRTGGISVLEADLERANERLRDAQDEARAARKAIDDLFDARGRVLDPANRLSRLLYGDPIMDTLKKAEGDAMSEVTAAIANVNRVKQAVKDLEMSKAVPTIGGPGGMLAHMMFAIDKLPKGVGDRADALLDRLKTTAATFGESAETAELYKLRLLGLTPAMQEQIENQIKWNKEMEENKRHMERAAEDAARLTEEMRTPLEVYNDEIEKLNLQLGQGIISETVFGRAVERAEKQLKDATDQTREARAELERLEGAMYGTAEAQFRIDRHLSRNELGGMRVTARGSGVNPEDKVVPLLARLVQLGEAEARRPKLEIGAGAIAG
jgi:chromosome segregation ATPase